jgi:cell division protein FtsI (penicillin-binding protein 3)
VRGDRSWGRLLALLSILLVSLLGIVVRLMVLQVRDASRFEQEGLDQRIRSLELPSERGRILDRAGTPLAVTVEATDVYADPRLVDDPGATAKAIARVLDTQVAGIRSLLRTQGTFVYLERQVDERVAKRIKRLLLPGIGLLPSTRRHYADDALAAQVLGFVGVDGVGLEGLEKQFDEVLAGTPGERTVEVAQFGEPIPAATNLERDPIPGHDVVTTIDRQIQFYAQLALRRAVRDNHASGGVVIVLDPHTGEIYAMATYPWFDPNRFIEFEQSVRRNRAVTDVFEPGSTNKIITAAAAIETGAVGLTQRFSVPWALRVGDSVIQDSHPHPVEQMTLADIVAASSNVGISKVADRVGNSRLASFLARFGFGSATGLGTPGESSGVVPSSTDWTDLTRSTVSFGEGVSVTPLQMAAVYSTIANGGQWVQPRLVKGTIDPDGEFHPADAPLTRSVVSEATADMLSRMLTYVVERGTGESAQIAGYQVAGKTGTAKKVVNGRYVRRYFASFIGFLPAGAPRVVVAAFIDEPATVYGSVAAAPLFKDVARYAIQRLGISPAPLLKLPPNLLASG